jgi:uncharacterized repeat protein (TIGR04076 family)
MSSDLIVEVAAIEGRCPIFVVGDCFTIYDGFCLQADHDLCMHALMALAPYYVALSRKVEPADLGLAGPDGAAYVQCLDPQAVTGGGTVTFRIRRVGSVTEQ